MDVHSQHPPVPAIPADAVSASSHGLRPRRRSSLPSIGIDVRPKRRAPNYIKTQTASPEVISNLIDSLSAISISAHNHFENLPTASASSPATPNLQSHFGADSLDVPNSDAHSSYYESIKNADYQYPDDACEPPVIRTSKPPSGLSPLTAPKRKDKDNSLKSYLSRGGGSSASIHSAHSGRSATSFGTISIEAGIPRKVSNGSARTSSESNRSARGHNPLMWKSSREQLRTKEVERKRATIQGPEVLSGEAARKATPQLFFHEDPIKEEPVVAESSRGAQRMTNRGASPLRNGVSIFTTNGAGSPTEQGLIPQRGSSLRNSGSPSRKDKKRGHGRKNSRHDSYKTNTVPEEDENPDPEPITREEILKDLEAEDDEVAQRIRELRKKKLLRDKIAGKLPVGVDVDAAAGASSSVPHVSPVASAELSPTSTVSEGSERQGPTLAKAHRLLGIAMLPTPPERRASRAPEPTELKEVHETSKVQAHTRTRSLTVNDGDDIITPLPIDYKLALQSLERPSSPPLSSNASSRGTVSSGTPPSRSKSAVGGRSANGRRAASSIIMGSSTAHKPTASVTGGAISERSSRATSEEIVPRHRSVHLSSPPPAMTNLQRKPTKKRWSHPDLPAKAERQHNDKIDAINAAVQLPPQPVLEERPTSNDSIDMEVEGYLNSPRLSQKIRHPQTGRIISFSEVGDPHGFAVFVCVGMGLTRFVMAFYDQLATTLKLRLITPDRPGIGGSQVDPNGTPLSWPGKYLTLRYQ